MATVYLIRAGQTTWEQESRVESTAGAPLSEQGHKEVQAAARQLANCNIGAIYAGTGESEQQTATLLAKALKLRVRTDSNLREIDYGLWQGLTIQEIKRRQPKVYRQWTEAPASVRPPGGETLEEVCQRLKQGLRDIVKRQKNGTALLALRPVAMALLHCTLRQDPIEMVREHIDSAEIWASYEADAKSL